MNCAPIYHNLPISVVDLFGPNNDTMFSDVARRAIEATLYCSKPYKWLMGWSGEMAAIQQWYTATKYNFVYFGNNVCRSWNLPSACKLDQWIIHAQLTCAISGNPVNDEAVQSSVYISGKLTIHYWPPWVCICLWYRPDDYVSVIPAAMSMYLWYRPRWVCICDTGPMSMYLWYRPDEYVSVIPAAMSMYLWYRPDEYVSVSHVREASKHGLHRNCPLLPRWPMQGRTGCTNTYNVIPWP